MKTLKHYVYSTGATLLGVAAPMVAFAADNPFNKSKDQIALIGEEAGINSGATLEEMIGSILNVVLGFLGILLLVYLLWGGFKWMTSGGSDEGVTQAKEMIRNAIIGLIIIVAAYAISTFVLESLVNVTNI